MIRLRGDGGFTLIEMVLAMVIMAGMAVLISNSIRNGLDAKRKFETQTAREVALRDSVQIMVRDIQLAFHHRDLMKVVINKIRGAGAAVGTATGSVASAAGGFARAGATPPATTPSNPAAAAFVDYKEPVELTGFVGADDKISFTTLNNFRIYQNAAESEQLKVGYEVKACKTHGPKPVSTKCLWRRTSIYLDDDVTKGGVETILLEHVKSLKLRYMGPNKEDWQTSWVYGKNGDEVTKVNFPFAVEFTIEVGSADEKVQPPISVTRVVALNFPNNEEKP